jgi:plastocyanin domain-containing protein
VRQPPDIEPDKKASRPPSSMIVRRRGRQGQADPQARLTYRKQQHTVDRIVAQSEPENKVMSARWIGALGILLVVGVLGWWVLNSRASSTPLTPSTSTTPTNSQQASPEVGAVSGSMGQDGKQTFDLVVNGDTWGYEPNVIEVKLGVPVHINLSTKGADPG